MIWTVNTHGHAGYRFAGTQRDHRGVISSWEITAVFMNRTPTRIHALAPMKLLAGQAKNASCCHVMFDDASITILHRNTNVERAKRFAWSAIAAQYGDFLSEVVQAGTRRDA